MLFRLFRTIKLESSARFVRDKICFYFSTRLRVGAIFRVGMAFPVHVTCEGESEAVEEDGIVEIPAVGNGIDDWVGGGVGFEEAGSAIDADGFGGGIFREANTDCARCDSDAFDVGGGEKIGGGEVGDDAGLGAAGGGL